MAATEGAIGFHEVAFELPYSTGMQLLWSYKVANGENVRAVSADHDRLHNVDELIG